MNIFKRIMWVKILAVAFVAVFCNGCILVPAIDGVKKIGLTKSDREVLLQPQVERFQEYIYWGKWQQAGELIREDVRSAQLREKLARAKGFRLVDSKVELIEFNEAGDQAVVDLTIRRYKVPFYLVEEQQEQQTWEFSLSSGWKFVKAENKSAA